MSTIHSPELDSALGGVESKLRRRIIKSYLSLRVAYASGEYDAAGLRVGAFAEAVVRLVQHELTGSYTPLGERLPQFDKLCASFEALPKTQGTESTRICIPRCLSFIYTLRNKRGIGHIGGDVEANEIDAATMVRAADWIVSELTRIYHSMSIEEAQELLDAIAVRQTPKIWHVAGKRRVLDTSLRYPDQTLLLLYGANGTAVALEDLADWVEHPRISDFKAKVISRLHEKRMVEWDRNSDTVVLSPLGISHVETRLLARTDERSGA